MVDNRLKPARRAVLIAVKLESGILLQGAPDLRQTGRPPRAHPALMTWLDYWPLPWLLYSALSMRILGLACLAMVAVAFSPFWSEKPHRVGVTADLPARNLL